MRRERRRLQARHIWEKIEPNWPMIEWTKQATGLPYEALYRRLFLHEYTEESRWLENSYKGPHVHWIRQQWERSRAWFAEQAAAQSPSQWASTLYLHRLDQIDALSWQWLDYHENLVEQVLRKLGTRILLPPALLSKQQDSPQLPQWIVNPFRTTQAHQTRSVLFT